MCVCVTASRYYRFPCLSLLLLLSTLTISILEGTSSYVCILYMQGRKSEKKMATLKGIALHGRYLIGDKRIGILLELNSRSSQNITDAHDSGTFLEMSSRK